MVIHVQETLNYWKQLEHVMKYFRAEEDPTAKLPNNFISGFLEVGYSFIWVKGLMLTVLLRAGIDLHTHQALYIHDSKELRKHSLSLQTP